MESNETAPDFTITDHNGKAWQLADQQGKWVVLYFYPKDDTTRCTTEAVDFTKRSTAFTKLGAMIIGVSPDGPDLHCKFRDKHSIDITLLSDPEKRALKLFGAWGIKKKYGKEYKGVIRSTYIIDPDGKIAASWINIKATGHAERVLKKLKALKAQS